MNKEPQTIPKLEGFKQTFPQYKDFDDDRIIEAIKKKYPQYTMFRNERIADALNRKWGTQTRVTDSQGVKAASPGMVLTPETIQRIKTESEKRMPFRETPELEAERIAGQPFSAQRLKYVGGKAIESLIPGVFEKLPHQELSPEAKKKLPTALKIGEAGVELTGNLLKYAVINRAVAPLMGTLWASEPGLTTLAKFSTLGQKALMGATAAGATFGTAEALKQLPEVARGKSLTEAAKEVGISTATGALLGSTARIPSAIGQIFADASIGFSSSKLRGAANEDAVVNAAFFAFFKAINAKNVKQGVRDAYIKDTLDSMTQKLVNQGMDAETASRVSERFLRMTVNKAGGHEKIDAKAAKNFRDWVAKEWSFKLSRKPEVRAERQLNDKIQDYTKWWEEQFAKRGRIVMSPEERAEILRNLEQPEKEGLAQQPAIEQARQAQIPVRVGAQPEPLSEGYSQTIARHGQIRYTPSRETLALPPSSARFPMVPEKPSPKGTVRMLPRTYFAEGKIQKLLAKGEKTIVIPVKKEAELPKDVSDFITTHGLMYKGKTDLGHVFEPSETKSSITIPADKLNAEELRTQLMRHYRDWGLTKHERGLYQKKELIAKPMTEEEHLNKIGKKAQASKQAKDQVDIAKQFEEFQPVKMPAGQIAESGVGAKFKIKGEEYEVKKAEPGRILIEDGNRYEVDEFDKIPVDRGEVEKGTALLQSKPKDKTLSPKRAKVKLTVKKTVSGKPKLSVVKVTKPQPITFYDKNQAERTGTLIEHTDKGAKIKYQGSEIFVPKERLKEKPAPVKPTEKQPWEMTSMEFYKSPLAKKMIGKPIEGTIYSGSGQPGRAGLNKWFTDQSNLVHKTEVRKALSEGKTVPVEVLKDYPELTAPSAGEKLPEGFKRGLKDRMTKRVVNRAEASRLANELKTKGWKVSISGLGKSGIWVNVEPKLKPQTSPPGRARMPVALETVKTEAGEQIVEPKLLGQAKMPKGKIKIKAQPKPITGREGVGFFKREEPGTGDLFVKESIAPYLTQDMGGRTINREPNPNQIKLAYNKALQEAYSGTSRPKQFNRKEIGEHEKRLAFADFLRILGYKQSGSQVSFFRSVRASDPRIKYYEKELYKQIDEFFRTGQKKIIGQVSIPKEHLQYPSARIKPSEISGITQLLSKIPTKTIKLGNLKVGDRYIEDRKGEVYVVTSKDSKKGTVKVQDGDKKTLPITKTIKIRGDVNAPETTFSGMQVHERERGFVGSVKEKGPGELKQRVAGQYIPRDTDELSIKARNYVNENPERAEVFIEDRLDDKAVAVATELVKKYTEMAQQAKSPTEQNLYWDKSAQIVNEFAPKLTELGRAVQAASIYGRLTPEGILRFAANEIKKYNEKGSKLGSRFFKKIPELTGEQVKKFTTELKRIQNMPDGVEKAMAFQKLQNEISKLIPSPFYKKLINLWKAGLLTGLKTTGLNLVANLSHGVSEIVKDVPAAIVDSVASLFTKQRTLAMTVRGSGGGIKEGFGKGWQYLKTGFDERDVWTKLDYRKVNFGQGRISRALQAYEQTIFKLMGAEDQPFYYGAKARSLMSQAIAQAKNQKLRGEKAKTFIDNFIKNPTTKALTYAVADAEIAVFQNKTALGAVARQIQKIPGGEFVVPFGRTPSAVAMQMVNYTPTGIVKEIIQQAYKGKFDQRKFSQSAGRSITGLGALMIGATLVKVGLLALSPKTEREKRQWELEGKKRNTIYINGKWRNVNTLGPLGMVLLIGGYYQKGLEETGSPMGALATATTGGMKSLTQQTFLTGISSLMEAIENPENFAKYYTQSQIGSIIPTIISDLAQATDEQQRELNGILDGLYARIPGLREQLEPRINALGDEVARQGNIIETMIDPSRPSRGIASGTIKELRRLMNAGYPATPTYFGRRSGFKSLTNEQNTRLEQNAGMLLEEKLGELIDSSMYKNMSDEKKSKEIKNLTDDTRMFTRIDMAIELIIGLSEQERKNKLANLLEEGFLTKEIYGKIQAGGSIRKIKKPTVRKVKRVTPIGGK